MGDHGTLITPVKAVSRANLEAKDEAFTGKRSAKAAKNCFGY